MRQYFDRGRGIGEGDKGFGSSGRYASVTAPPGCQVNMERQTVSIMKACEVVGVSRRTIYNWISAGKVEYVRTAGGSIRIFADTLWRSSAGSQMTPSAPSQANDAQARTPGSHA